MRLTSFEAHAICAALVSADLVARAWRIRLLTGGLGHRIGFGEAFTVNAVGDAACAVTPMRIGGEPARLAGMLHARVPASAALIAIGLETLTAWPVTIAVAGWMVSRHGATWWADVGPSLGRGLLGAWPWVVGVLLVTVVLWWIVRRKGAAGRPGRRAAIRAVAYLRRMPPGVLVATVPLSLVNLIARMGILPVLVLALPDAPPMGPLWLGSFALLYAQLLLPTPSGAGAVDLGFLHGAAGELGGAEAALLVAWRFYTSGIGIVVGFALAAHRYGIPGVRRLVTAARAQ